MPTQPASTSQRACLAMRSRSISMSSSNGVVIAGMTPVHATCIACSLRAPRHACLLTHTIRREEMQPLGPVPRLQVVDSHTGGEPTRVVVAGGPDLGRGPLSQRLERLRAEHDWLRRAAVNEPRGSDVLVGALLCEPQDPRSAAGVIFF